MRLCLLFALALVAAAQDKPDPTVLYADESWTHIGDGNFAADSNAAGDMTFAVEGGALELRFAIAPESRALLADTTWTCVELSGEVIGNDVARLDTVQPTRVLLDGKQVGTITASGAFRIQIPLTAFAPELEEHLLRIESGENGEHDRDDQELGMFTLRLSREPLPAPKEEPEAPDE